MRLRSYRARLLSYGVVLGLLLTGTLFYSYHYVQNVIEKEASQHLSRMVRLLDAHLSSERAELKRYAEIISKNLRLKEYLFIVEEVGVEAAPLRELYERHFGSLPITREIILDSSGNIVVGKQYADLSQRVDSVNYGLASQFNYFRDQNNIELVVSLPIIYRDSLLGHLAITRLFDQQWLEQVKQNTGGEIFVEYKGQILSSTIATAKQARFEPSHLPVVVSGERYQVEKIELAGADAGMPSLWYGLSETTLTQRIQRHKQITLALAVLGIAAIVISVYFMMCNFSRPMQELTRITRKVAEGEFPTLKKSLPGNEVEELANHFADMLQALRNKQTEIDLIHAELEESAITDTLTGLYNRRYLQDVLPKLQAQASREDKCVAAILMDLDHFKLINDTHGHLIGDRCLKHFTDTLRRECRASDYLLRLGGEEFLILNLTQSLRGAVALAEKIRAAIEKNPARDNDVLIQMTVSSGVTCAPPANSGEDALQQMLSQADEALYRAKEMGRNHVCAIDRRKLQCSQRCFQGKCGVGQ